MSQAMDTSAEATRLHQLLLQGYRPHDISGVEHKEKKKPLFFSLPEKFISTVQNCFEAGVRVSLIKNPPCWCRKRAIFYTKKKNSGRLKIEQTCRQGGKISLAMIFHHVGGK